VRKKFEKRRQNAAQEKKEGDLVTDQQSKTELAVGDPRKKKLDT